MKFYRAMLWTVAVAITIVFGLSGSANASPLKSVSGVLPCTADCLLQHVDDDEDKPQSKSRADESRDDDDDDGDQDDDDDDDDEDEDDGGAKKRL